MSVAATNWAWRCSKLSTAQRVVLLRLADHADADGICWPRLDSVADDCELSERHVRRIVEQLCARGLVVKLRRLRNGRGKGPWVLQLTVDNAVDYRSRVSGTRTPRSGPLAPVRQDDVADISGDVPDTTARRTGHSYGRAKSLGTVNSESLRDADAISARLASRLKL